MSMEKFQFKLSHSHHCQLNLEQFLNWNGFLSNGHPKKSSLKYFVKKIKENGRVINIELIKELKEVSLNFGVINAIIHGPRIMELSNFIFASKKNLLDFWMKKSRYLLELLRISLIAKIVLFGQIQVNFYIKVIDLNQNILALSTLIKHHFLLVILFWKFLVI